MEELHAFRLTPQNLPALAAFMAKACPQWWDEAGAAGQLSGTGLTIGTVGWLLGKDEAHLSGWLLCRELFLYHCLEVECCGFFQQDESVSESFIPAFDGTGLEDTQI